ncbi:MAG: STAS/SEC14 domain-containing protein [Deltaproteobacteria bacterium]|nr:STAS/SEC14 domain-containing protein [Deltaproteobacteria bacterium]
MVEMIDVGIDRAVAFRIDGKVKETEMVHFFSEAKAKIELYENIVVYEEIVNFSGIEIKGIIAEFKFLHEIGLSHIEKIAVVTDKKWLEKIVGVEDKIFKSIDIKTFSTEEKDKAIEFLKNA